MYPDKVDDKGYPKPGTTTPQQTILNLYGRISMKQYGTWKIPCKYKDRSTVAEFYIVDKDGPAISGLPPSKELRLITVHCAVTTNPGVTHMESQKPITSKEDLIVMYPDRFQGIGR